MKLTVGFQVNLKIKEAISMVEKATRKGLKDTITDIANDTIKGSPVDTGNNRRSIRYEVGPGLEGAVYSTSGYGGWLEVGTPPHVITVKTAKVLTDGKTFFGKSVNHPGTKPHPYFKPALDKNIGKLPQNIKTSLETKWQ